jgi:hypothetical protein
VLFVSLGELRIDDSQGQVQQKEGSNEDQGQEVQKDDVSVGLLHLLLDITPSFKGHRLEHTQQGVHYVVEVGDSKVWVLVGSAAEVTTWTFNASAKWLIRGMHLSCLDAHAPFHQIARHQVGSSNGEDGEEE